MPAVPFFIQPLDEPPSEDQLAAVLAVYRQCEDFLALGPQPRASLAMVRSDLAFSRGEGGLFCGIHHAGSGEMIGVLDYVPAGYAGQPEDAFVSLLMIAAPWRGAGLGAAVQAWLETEARRAGVSRILAGVQVNNPAAIRFWQRMGYRIVSGAEPQEDGTVAYRLCKQLDEPDCA